MVDGLEPVFERPGEHCGAVETPSVLGTDLGKDIGTVAATQGGVAGAERVKGRRSAGPTAPIELNAAPEDRRVEPARARLPF